MSRPGGRVGSSPTPRRRRVLVAKLGLDGHDVGAKFIARLLRDHGFEVVYLGIRQTPEAVVNAAIAEDVDVVGLSILSGAHETLTRRFVELMEEQGASDVPVVIGGVIPDSERSALRSLGIVEIFDAGTPTTRMVERIREIADTSAGAGR